MINRIIRNFEIKELIATGGMAAIYKATQISLDRIVAVKILHGHLAQDKDFITRFEREAKAAANLKHENIVNIIDFGETEGVYFIAMEYVEGKSLKDLISTLKFIPYDIGLNIVYEICQGLNHAHQKGVVHRDIKPANILIAYDGVVKITDFGLAQAQDLTSVTVTGSIVGTPAYMSPEQAAGKKVDNRSDIFSLGVVMYEMMTGIKPFHGENYSSVIHEILTVTPAKPTEINPIVTKDVSNIVEKMLEKDMDKRYQKIFEVSNDISSYFSKKKTEISRKGIAEFISTPAENLQNLLKERKEKHFERALYFMGLGYDKIDDAINEFDKVLQLDPEDTRAKKYLFELKQKKERPAPPKPEKPAIAPAKKSSLLPIGIISGILVLAILLLAFFMASKKGLPPASITKNLGIVNVKSTPEGASIHLDDNKNLTLVTPARIDSIAIGVHKIELKKSSYKTYIENFEIKGGDSISLNAILEKETIALAYGTIIVRSTPKGASVIVDGVNKGFTTPCAIENVEVGLHRIKIEKSGFKPIEVTRDVMAKKAVQVIVNLQSEALLSSDKFSYLKIRVNPWAKIYIENRYIETTPIANPIRIPAGTYTVRLENPNFKSWQSSKTFNPGDTLNLDVRLEPLEGYLKLVVEPWADVYIDGKFYETTPIAAPIKLSAGSHTLKLINPTFKTYEEKIAISANKLIKKYVALTPK